MLTKSCIVCLNEFKVKRYRFYIALFCSAKCYGVSERGRIPKSAFKKGHTATATAYQSGKNHPYFGKSSPALGKHWKQPADAKKRIQKGIPKEYMQGDSHWNWNGGITPEHKRIRTSLEYKLWREAVFRRDNYACVLCGITDMYLNADHIKPFSQYPELRVSIDNGRTLCVDCHKKTDTYGYKGRKKKLVN